MTPAAFRVFAKSRINEKRDNRRYQDNLMAAQTSRLMYMQGRTLKAPITPNECMAFDWTSTENSTVDEIKPKKSVKELMQIFDIWAIATGGKNV